MSTAEVAAGDQLPGLEVHVTRAMLVAYAGASTDLNPIHWSDRAARALGLEGVIAHGMLTMGLALRLVTDWVEDPGLVLSYSVRFTRPVVVPDNDEGALVSFAGKVTAVGDGVATVSIEARCGDDNLLGGAKAEVKLV